MKTGFKAGGIKKSFGMTTKGAAIQEKSLDRYSMTKEIKSTTTGYSTPSLPFPAIVGQCF